MSNSIEVPLNRLIIGFGLVFMLGILFSILNSFYVEETNTSLPIIVYIISIFSLVLGVILVLLFQWRISKFQLNSILKILQKHEAEVIRVLLDNNKRLEQNHLVALSGYNKVKISRILAKFEKRNVIEKRNIGNTNLIILKVNN